MRAHWSTAIGLPTLISYLLHFCWICSNNFVPVAASPIVQIKNGTLEGTVMKSRNGKEFLAFRGIPYAQPPIGKLRFESPKPSDSWTGVRSAKDDSEVCIQRNSFANQQDTVGVEDCLYLNVFTPKLIPKNPEDSRQNYPVMVWLHGGAWFTGSAQTSMYGPKFLLDHDVILVTVNYRLGPLGFLSTEDLVSPGNQGLKDQSQAIRWVHENIANFNGDPNSVTIFGESAGGASVHYQMISPLSKGLFHRAIAQSGTAICPWALAGPGVAKANAKKVGKLLGCPTDKSSSLVDCLKEKNAADIIATDHAFQVFGLCPIIPFRPVIEPDHPGAFLKEDPAKILKTGKVTDVPLMTGITSHEGAIKVSDIYGNKDKDYVKILDEEFEELAPITLLYEHTCPEELKHNVTNSIREFYLGDKKIDESTRWMIIDMYTDAWFYIGTDNTVRGHLDTLSSPVYYYYFAYRGTGSFSAIFGDAEKDYGVCHSDELQYLFPIDELLLPNITLTKEDLEVADVLTELWVNFAKSGNPTPEETPKIPIKWKPVRTSKLEYLHIGGAKDLHMNDDLLADRRNFWANIPHRANVKLNDNAHRTRDELQSKHIQ